MRLCSDRLPGKEALNYVMQMLWRFSTAETDRNNIWIEIQRQPWGYFVKVMFLTTVVERSMLSHPLVSSLLTISKIFIQSDWSDTEAWADLQCVRHLCEIISRSASFWDASAARSKEPGRRCRWCSSRAWALRSHAAGSRRLRPDPGRPSPSAPPPPSRRLTCLRTAWPWTQTLQWFSPPGAQSSQSPRGGWGGKRCADCSVHRWRCSPDSGLRTGGCERLWARVRSPWWGRPPCWSRWDGAGPAAFPRGRPAWRAPGHRLWASRPPTLCWVSFCRPRRGWSCAAGAPVEPQCCWELRRTADRQPAKPTRPPVYLTTWKIFNPSRQSAWGFLWSSCSEWMLNNCFDELLLLHMHKYCINVQCEFTGCIIKVLS